MGFWEWFWIWVLLTLASLVVFAFIGRSLFERAMLVAREIAKVTVEVEKLTEQMGSYEKAAPHGPSTLITPEQAATKRLSFLKAKAKKREDRQRILIRSLKKYDSKESRFH